MTSPRRSFLKNSAVLLAAAVAPLGSRAADATPNPLAENPARPRQKLERVQTFVRVAHTDLPAVQRMLAEEPALLHASWDWGNGDWENALEAASHRANRPIVEFLLEQGARLNPFCLAMLGRFEAIAALLAANPALADSRAPHGLTLLYHAALGSRVDLVELVGTNIRSGKAAHFNQALLGAARDGSKDVVAWLLAHGVTDASATDIFDRSPLDYAQTRGDAAIVALLKDRGARSGKP